jgi:hypothetical protein
MNSFRPPLRAARLALAGCVCAVNAGDARVYLFYSAPPALGQDQKDPTHTSNFGVKLQERCREFGVPCELVYPGAPGVKHPTIQEYLIATLKGPAR